MVMLGTVISQALPILILTVLSRSYTVEDVGVYVLWLSITSILVAVATLSFEQSMYVVKSKIEVRSIFKVLFLAAILILLILYIINIFLYYATSLSMVPEELEEYSLSIVTYAFLLSLLQGMYSWFIYESRFLALSVLKVSVATLVVMVQVFVIAIDGELSDLIFTQVVITFIVVCFFQYRERLFPFNDERMLSASKMFILSKRFIYYSTPASVVNAFVNQLPIMLIAANYGVAFSAFYGLANKMLTVPSSLLSGSIMTVFRYEAGEEFRSTGQCMIAFKKTLKALLVISVVPFLMIFFLAEFLFALVFGEEWRVAGQYARYLIPFVFVGFVASPLSYTLLLVQWQGVNLIWQISLLLLTCFIFVMNFELIFAIQTYSIMYSIMYLIYLMISYQAAKGNFVK